MFSSRTSWDLRPNRLSELLREKRRRGEEIIDLTESNPTRCGFEYPADRILQPLAARQSLLYEPDPRGLPAAREAVAEFYRRQDVRVGPEQVFLTASTSEAYSYLFCLLCDSGDSALLPKPGYPLFEFLCQLHDVRAIPFRLQYDGEWHVNAKLVAKSIAEDTRAIVLVHPNNPTGSFVKSTERCELEMIAERRGLALIVDEVFGQYGFDADERRAPSFADSEAVLTFTLGGLSKLVGLPQMKVAWIVVSGPQDLSGEAMRRLEVIADTYLSVGTPVQHALPAMLLQVSSLISHQIMARVQTNFEILRGRFPSGSPVTVLDCEGGWNAVLRFPTVRSPEEWAHSLLLAQNVLVHPGHLFDFDIASCVVVSLLPAEPIVEEACTRIAAALDLG